MTTAPPTLADLRRLPGASTYRVANAAILLARKALKLEDQFELTFEDWGPGNRVYDWYKGLRNPNVQVMHLRKERASPFYHEFIALQLKDGTFWRIDRRQHQDEPTPINCIQPKGVPAFDTIEQVNGLGLFLGLDPLSTGASNSMIELEFKQDVDVGLVLRICRAIKEHTYAKVYTLQRYNCFFFAQTVIMCTACGVSDWAGRGELAGDLEGPWKSPNAPLNYSWSLMDNASRSKGFVWKPTESFGHDWDELSKQSSAVVRTSLALMHADHCDLCLASKTPGQLRSLSMEINRFKQELVEYWDQEYCQLLAEAYRMNHEKLVNSGIWGIITGNMAREDCEDMLPEKLTDIQIKWDEYSEQRLAELLKNVSDILDPKEPCENWHVDPDEWGSSWNCEDGGPVKPAREKWERDVIQFINNEFIKLEKELKDKTTQNSFDMHAAAKRARIDSFQEAMTIKLRTLDEDEFLKPMQPGTDALGKKLPDVETVRTKRTAVSAVSSKISKAVTKRATKIKNRMRRLFKASHQLETADIMQMERRIRVFLQKHGENLNLYRPWLKCTSEVVQADMKRDMNEVWNCIIR